MLQFFNGSSILIKLDEDFAVTKSYFIDLKSYFRKVFNRSDFAIAFNTNLWYIDVSIDDAFLTRDEYNMIKSEFPNMKATYQNVYDSLDELPASGDYEDLYN